jgi:ubiquinone/menaquinone biosynthesis C-methylase UbiE
MPPPHDPTIAGYTTSASIAEGYDRHHEYLRDFFGYDTEFLLATLPPGARVVDIGCGTGRHLVALSRHGYRMTGVDLSPHMLARAAKKLERLGLSAELLNADACDLGRLADASFDCAISMFSTFGLIRGRRLRRRALGEWRRVLAPGGVLVLHVHNVWHHLRDAMGRRWLAGSLLRSLLPGREFGDTWVPDYYGLPSLYIHLFSWRELRGLLRDAGFSLVRAVFLDEPRTGGITGRFTSLRANGFFVVVRKG